MVPGPPPRYDTRALDVAVLEERLTKLGLCEARAVARPLHNLSQGSGLGRPQLDPPLSPISETPPDPNLELLQVASSSGSNTRSVSAAVSDESVAGDSGVFEASKMQHSQLEAAQIQIRLRYLSIIFIQGIFLYQSFFPLKVCDSRLSAVCWY